MLESVQRPLYRGNELKEPRDGHHFRLGTFPIRLADLFIAIVVVARNRTVVNCLQPSCSPVSARARAHTQTGFRSHVHEAYGWSTNTSTRVGHRSTRPWIGHPWKIRGGVMLTWSWTIPSRPDTPWPPSLSFF